MLKDEAILDFLKQHRLDLKFFLKDKLGRSVDLVLADSLKPRLKPIITREVAYA